MKRFDSRSSPGLTESRGPWPRREQGRPETHRLGGPKPAEPSALTALPGLSVGGVVGLNDVFGDFDPGVRCRARTTPPDTDGRRPEARPGMRRFDARSSSAQRPQTLRGPENIQPHQEVVRLWVLLPSAVEVLPLHHAARMGLASWTPVLLPGPLAIADFVRVHANPSGHLTLVTPAFGANPIRLASLECGRHLSTRSRA